MRILANYGFRSNGDSYSVTFETVGDVPMEQADSSVDELFSMAKRAIERQVNSTSNQHEQPTEDVVIPAPKKNGNGNGKYTNGNGHGSIQSKDAFAPISAKQRNLIIKLAKERGRRIENLDQLGMAKASELIKDLLAVTA